ncbi:MAG TPA: DUF1624 domain-containing protein [Clostridiaceae bacterium]|nr:DUF1624 domain-containing protein [Clostridiaceae bacterium]
MSVNNHEQPCRTPAGRIWELDFFRGIALLLMIYFHFIFDMNEMFNYPVSYTSGINYYIGKISAILFIFISGISSSLSRSNIKRGLRVLAIALVITVATHLYGAEFGIKFGILHFLGICMLLYPLIRPVNNYLLVIICTMAIILGYYAQKVVVPYNYLFPFGLTSISFTSSDYYPLFPWSGLFIYGVVFGKVFYSSKKSLLPFNPNNNVVVRAVSFLGRNTLLIYLIHQPVTIAILTLINYL